MGSDNNLCEWHLPKLEQTKPAEKHHKKKNRQTSTMDRDKPTKSYSFQHFSDPAMYIDDYRKKHTLANAATDWKPNDHRLPKKNARLSDSLTCQVTQTKYVDTRVPERKICLTGLPQLKLSHNVPCRVAAQSTDDTRPFMSNIPHLPRLNLNGIPKNIKERQINHNYHKKDHHRKKKGKKKDKGRLPFLKPNIDFENGEQNERILNYNFPVP